MVLEHLPDILNFLLLCDSCYVTYQLQNKDEPENIKRQRAQVKVLMSKLSLLSENPDLDLFDSRVVTIMDTQFGEILAIFEDWLRQEKLKPKKFIEEVKDDDEPIIKDVSTLEEQQPVPEQ